MNAFKRSIIQTEITNGEYCTVGVVKKREIFAEGREEPSGVLGSLHSLSPHRLGGGSLTLKCNSLPPTITASNCCLCSPLPQPPYLPPEARIFSRSVTLLEVERERELCC